MDLKETGFLLRVRNYPQCVEFYSKVLELPIRLQKEALTNFQFGDSYLLVELGETYPEAVQRRQDPPFVLRLNVGDVDASAQWVRDKGVPVNRYSCDWGEIANFRDPDGNLVEFCRWK